MTERITLGPVAVTWTMTRQDKIDGLREFIADATAELLRESPLYPLAADIARAERDLSELESSQP
jgi:hypothetical protein